MGAPSPFGNPQKPFSLNALTAHTHAHTQNLFSIGPRRRGWCGVCSLLDFLVCDPKIFGFRSATTYHRPKIGLINFVVETTMPYLFAPCVCARMRHRTATLPTHRRQAIRMEMNVAATHSAQGLTDSSIIA